MPLLSDAKKYLIVPLSAVEPAVINALSELYVVDDLTKLLDVPSPKDPLIKSCDVAIMRRS